jgi:16S rRNA (cytidine1402-2'-O)-methyltransferase
MQLFPVSTLYLIPVPIVATGTYNQVIPEYNVQIIQQLDYFFVEDVRTARRFIKEVGHPKSLADIHMVEFNKHQPIQDIEAYMQPLQGRKDVGILSESGCPGIADPGAELVHYAHQHSIPVIPLVGPCSLLLALMASGFSGQHFAFHGYLPIGKQARKQAIRQIEAAAYQNRQTQIFIETPYRNQIMLEALLETCKPTTWLCIGKDITAPQGWIRSLTIQQWKNNKPQLSQVPAVFLLSGN